MVGVWKLFLRSFALEFVVFGLSLIYAVVWASFDLILVLAWMMSFFVFLMYEVYGFSFRSSAYIRRLFILYAVLPIFVRLA